jgi:hypothetical protein
METYFVRHTQKLDIDEKTYNMLLEENLIAIHFPYKSKSPTNEKDDCTSTDPDDYENSSAKNAMRTLRNLSKEGGYVCAEYRTIKGALIGMIKPHTPIKLLEGTWGTQKERKAVLKTLSLEKVQRIDPENYLKVSFARPIQGTICQWSKAGNRIECLVNGTQFEPTFDNISPVHQEVLCSEYLRSGIDCCLPMIQSFLLPVGRTLKDIDIYGVTQAGEKVYSQVTYKNFEQSHEKLEKLKKYRSENSHVVLFCKSSDTSHREVDGMLIYSIEKVFNEYTKTPMGKAWLKGILG